MINAGLWGGGGGLCVYLINAGLCSVERGVGGGFHAYFNYAGLCSLGGGGGSSVYTFD